jgi:hypothetical protein
MPQIYHMGPAALLPLRRKACWGIFRPEKYGFEPANLGTRGQHASSRPPKPLRCNVTHFIYFCEMLYMFQAVTPPIIRSSKLYIEHRVLVKLLLLPAAIVKELELVCVCVSTRKSFHRNK